MLESFYQLGLLKPVYYYIFTRHKYNVLNYLPNSLLWWNISLLLFLWHQFVIFFIHFTAKVSSLFRYIKYTNDCLEYLSGESYYYCFYSIIFISNWWTITQSIDCLLGYIWVLAIFLIFTKYVFRWMFVIFHNTFYI